MRLITQDNLWHLGPGRHGYVWKGQWPMIPFEPFLGQTASSDPGVKSQELQWLLRYTGRNGANLVVAHQWQEQGDAIDRNLNDPWLPIFERHGQRGKFIIFYDLMNALRPIADPVDFRNPEVMARFRSDLDHLSPHFRHRKYFKIDGQPVVYFWAVRALVNGGVGLGEVKRRGLYTLCDVFGGRNRPANMDAVTGFVSVIGGHGQHRRILDVLPELESEFEFWRDKGVLVPASSLQYDDTEFQEALRQEGNPLYGGATRHLAAGKEDVREVLRLLGAYAREGMIFLGTANNWAEGTTCLPVEPPRISGRPAFSLDRIGSYGFEHLEAIQEVLFPNLTPYTGPRLTVKRRRRNFVVYKVEDLDVLGTLRVKPKSAKIYDKERAGFVRRIKVRKGARIVARNLDGKKAVIEEVRS